MPGHFEAALTAVREETGLSRTKLSGIWGSYKKAKKHSIRRSEWVSKLSNEYGGLNAVIDLEEKKQVNTFPPEDFEVVDIEARIIKSIDSEVEENRKN